MSSVSVSPTEAAKSPVVVPTVVMVSTTAAAAAAATAAASSVSPDAAVAATAAGAGNATLPEAAAPAGAGGADATSASTVSAAEAPKTMVETLGDVVHRVGSFGHSLLEKLPLEKGQEYMTSSRLVKSLESVGTTLHDGFVKQPLLVRASETLHEAVTVVGEAAVAAGAAVVTAVKTHKTQFIGTADRQLQEAAVAKALAAEHEHDDEHKVNPVVTALDGLELHAGAEHTTAQASSSASSAPAAPVVVKDVLAADSIVHPHAIEAEVQEWPSPPTTKIAAAAQAAPTV